MPSVRDFLEQREHELLQRIDDLLQQAQELLDRVQPLQAELADVRSAKQALSKEPPNNPLATVRTVENALGIINTTDNALSTYPATAGALAVGLINSGRGAATGIAGPGLLTFSYGNLTMKQLVVMALRDRFPQGATTRQLVDYIRDGYGRNIDRASLSPQISRLHRDRVIGRSGETIVNGEAVSGPSRWFLMANPNIDKLIAQDSPPGNELTVDNDD